MWLTLAAVFLWQVNQPWSRAVAGVMFASGVLHVTVLGIRLFQG